MLYAITFGWQLPSFSSTCYLFHTAVFGIWRQLQDIHAYKADLRRDYNRTVLFLYAKDDLLLNALSPVS